MSERLADLLVGAGIDAIIAEPFCKGLGGNDHNFANDFKNHSKFWLDQVVAEARLFAIIGSFTTEARFEKYVDDHQWYVYVHEMFMSRILYGDRFHDIVAASRSIFMQKFKSNPKKLAWDIFWWDNYWSQDAEIGKLLLDTLAEIPAKEREKPERPLPLVPVDEKDYKGKVLYPALVPLRDMYSDLGSNFLVDFIYFLGITGMNQLSIKTNLLYGRAGKKKNDVGLLKFESSYIKNPAMNSDLGSAFFQRKYRAHSLILDARVEVAEQNPQDFELWKSINNRLMRTSTKGK